MYSKVFALPMNLENCGRWEDKLASYAQFAENIAYNIIKTAKKWA